MVIWVIGLSGAGKTAIGRKLAQLIFDHTRKCIYLDGDIVREILGDNPGYSVEGRRKNAERICRLCRYLDSQSTNVVCGILSIFEESRSWNKANIPRYFEVFVDAPLGELKKRDSKGLYRRAGEGLLKDVVGVDIEFPVPKSPDLVLRNDFTESVPVLAGRIFERVKDRLY